MTCGLEQDVPVFQDEWNVYERTCPFEALFEETSIKTHFNETFEKIQSIVLISDDLKNTAKQILQEYFDRSPKTIKGEQRRLEFCTACVFYASKDLNHGAFVSQSHIVEKVFKNESFYKPCIQWACKDLSATMINTSFKHLFLINPQQSSSKVLDTFPILLHKVFDHMHITKQLKETEKNQKKIISLTCTKMLDAIKTHNSEIIFLTQPEKLTASIVFVTCKILKVNLKLHVAALLLDVSEPLLLKMEKKILDVLKKNNKK